MDRRQQKSRTAILSAFEELLARENYSKITVQQIIDEANVGRTTFYAHFETKDELLRELCTELFNHVFSDYPDPAGCHDFPLPQGDFRTIVAHILYHLREKGTNLARLMVGESGGVFLRYFREYLNQVAYPHMLDSMMERRVPVPEDFLRNHISGSFVNMVQWWIEGEMRESPEELADHFMKVIQPIFQK